jgi:hypothetical protein
MNAGAQPNPDQGLSQKKPVNVGSQGTDCSPQNCEPRKRNHRVADAEYVECQPHRNLHQRKAPMKDAAKQSQSGRAGIHFFSDAADGNGGNGPKCLTDCNRKGQHRQLHDLGWIHHCEAGCELRRVNIPRHLAN